MLNIKEMSVTSMSSSPPSEAATSAVPTTQDKKEELRKEIVEIFSRRSRKSTRLSPHVRKISDTLVVKRRLLSAKDEFENQLKAWELLDPQIVRVPRPIDCFSHEYPNDRIPTGFLVMEYVATGKQLDNLTDTQIDQVADIVRYLATFKGKVPGGLMGGWMRGVLFEGDQPPEPGSMEKLNEWIHIRRTITPDTAPKPFVDFGQLDLVLCHLDIAPRNIL